MDNDYINAYVDILNKMLHDYISKSAMQETRIVLGDKKNAELSQINSDLQERSETQQQEIKRLHDELAERTVDYHASIKNLEIQNTDNLVQHQDNLRALELQKNNELDALHQELDKLKKKKGMIPAIAAEEF